METIWPKHWILLFIAVPKYERTHGDPFDCWRVFQFNLCGHIHIWGSKMFSGGVICACLTSNAGFLKDATIRHSIRSQVILKFFPSCHQCWSWLGWKCNQEIVVLCCFLKLKQQIWITTLKLGVGGEVGHHSLQKLDGCVWRTRWEQFRAHLIAAQSVQGSNNVYIPGDFHTCSMLAAKFTCRRRWEILTVSRHAVGANGAVINLSITRFCQFISW